MRALRFDPIAARPARVARRQALLTTPSKPNLLQCPQARRLAAILPLTEEQVALYMPLVLPLAISITGLLLIAVGAQRPPAPAKAPKRKGRKPRKRLGPRKPAAAPKALSFTPISTAYQSQNPTNTPARSLPSCRRTPPFSICLAAGSARARCSSNITLNSVRRSAAGRCCRGQPWQ